MSFIPVLVEILQLTVPLWSRARNHVVKYYKLEQHVCLIFPTDHDSQTQTSGNGQARDDSQEETQEETQEDKNEDCSGPSQPSIEPSTDKGETPTQDQDRDNQSGATDDGSKGDEVKSKLPDTQGQAENPKDLLWSEEEEEEEDDDDDEPFPDTLEKFGYHFIGHFLLHRLVA